MHVVHTIHGSSATAWILHEDPDLVRSDELNHHTFDTKMEADAFRSGIELSYEYFQQYGNCSHPMFVLDEDENIKLD